MKVLTIALVLAFLALPLIAGSIENPGKTTPAVILSSKVEGVVGDIGVEIQKSAKVSGVNLDLPDGPVFRESPSLINIENLSNPDDPTSANTSVQPIEKRMAFREREFPTGELSGRWGNDITIYSGYVGTGIDFDEDETTNDIYAAFDTYHATNDSLKVFRSTDGGDTWSLFLLGTNTDGYIENPKVRVATDASGQDWVCFIGIWYEPSGAQTLWMRRIKTDGTGVIFEKVTTGDVDYADLDADVGTGAWVYATYIPKGSDNDIYAVRNYLDGTGWKDDQSLFVDPGVFPYPQIAAGAGGNIAVTFIDDRATTNNEVRIKRSGNYGSTWISSEQVSNNSAAATLLFTDIAYSHGSTQTGWIFVTFRFSAGDNLAYYYSTDSGVNWTYGTVIGGGGDENMSTLRARKATGSVTVAYNEDPGDSTMFTWASASTPTDFTTPVRINDNAATGIWSPVAGWITRGGGNSAIIYSRSGGIGAYFDWFGNTAIEEKPGREIFPGFVRLAPNPSRDLAKLSYNIKKDGNVRIALFNATGRLVETFADGHRTVGSYTTQINVSSVSSGVYFLKVISPDGTFTRRLTVVK